MCKSDVFDDGAHSGFIIPVVEWNRYRHYTYQNDREAEKVYIKSVGPTDATNTVKKSATLEPARPPIYDQFDYVSSGTHQVKQRDGAAKEVKCEYWRCKNTSGKCKTREPFKVVSKATTKMLAHLKRCNPAAYTPIALASKGSTGEVDADGNVIKMRSFKEMLPDHVRFVIMIVLEWDHFKKCRSESRQEYVKGLKPGAGLPHRNTCIKILQVIKGLMGDKLGKTLLALLNELGSRAIGAQDDIWSMKNCREVHTAPPPPPPPSSCPFLIW